MLSFLPEFIFREITDISPEFLSKHGIRLLLMDFDNTMLPYTTNVPTKELLCWIDEMKKAGVTLCIVSNSHKDRIPDFSRRYDVPCIMRACKPGRKGILRAMQEFQTDKSRTALVGDQIFTDVLGANFAGVTSIAVKSIHNHTFWLKLRHVFEVPFLAMARKRRVY